MRKEEIDWMDGGFAHVEGGGTRYIKTGEKEEEEEEEKKKKEKKKKKKKTSKEIVY